MALRFNATIREVLEQLVREPRFREITTIPLLATPVIGLITTLVVGFGVNTWLYLNAYSHAVVLVLGNGLLAYSAFTLLHDGTHRALSSNRTLNDAIGTFAALWLLPGFTTQVYRFLHMEHHRYAGDVERDPDEVLVSTPWPLMPFVLTFVELYWLPWYARRWNKRPIAERMLFVGGILIYIIWHVLWLSSPWAMTFVLAWMIPQRIGLLSNAYLFARIQHPEGVHWEDSPFQCVVEVQGNRLQRFLMLGQCAHCLHHFAPSVPFYRYYAAWNSGRHLFKQHNIPVRGFFTPVRDLVLPERNATVLRQSVVVTRVQQVAEDVLNFELRAIEGAALAAFEAGAHVDVYLADGLVRQYSLCGSPFDRERYTIAIKREELGRGGSIAAHEQLQHGARIDIGLPRNNFPLAQAASHYQLVAAGIGLTPLLSMAHQLHRRGDSFDLHICAKNRARLPFADVLSTLPFASRISIHLAEAEQRFDVPRDIGNYTAGQQLLVCGPAGFMRGVESELNQCGWPGAAIISETFVAPIDVDAENRPFEVKLARSGKLLKVGADEILLDVLNANGCAVPCSCTQGICGSCITPVLEGVPEHRDAILSDAERDENRKMCVCVGRARSERLVLDL